MCADGREVQEAEAGRQERLGRLADDAAASASASEWLDADEVALVAPGGPQAEAERAQLETVAAAVLSDMNDGWVAEAIDSRQQLASWKQREDYAFDGSMAAAEGSSSVFAGFEEDEAPPPEAEPEPSACSRAASTGSTSSSKPPFASTVLLGTSDSDDDDDDDDGLFSVVDKNGVTKPAVAAAAATRIFGDDDL
jgi:hypothetical protein